MNSREEIERLSSELEHLTKELDAKRRVIEYKTDTLTTAEKNASRMPTGVPSKIKLVKQRTEELDTAKEEMLVIRGNVLVTAFELLCSLEQERSRLQRKIQAIEANLKHTPKTLQQERETALSDTQAELHKINMDSMITLTRATIQHLTEQIKEIRQMSQDDSSAEYLAALENKSDTLRKGLLDAQEAVLCAVKEATSTQLLFLEFYRINLHRKGAPFYEVVHEMGGRTVGHLKEKEWQAQRRGKSALTAMSALQQITLPEKKPSHADKIAETVRGLREEREDRRRHEIEERMAQREDRKRIEEEQRKERRGMAKKKGR